MKKRFIAITLIVLICVSIAGCGKTDYKQVGYDAVKQALSGKGSDSSAEEIEEAFSYLISIYGADFISSEMNSGIDGMTADEFIEAFAQLDINIKSISDDNLVLIKEGAKECLQDYIAKISQ